MSAFVSTDWLAEHLSDPNIRVVDATYFLPTMNRDADAEFLERHIPGAVRFDVDAVKDEASPLPHMLPTPERFAEAMTERGIGSDCLIVAYDVHGLMSAGRLWWMARVFGHDRAVVLDGGLPKWLAEGREVESGPAQPVPRAFKASFRPELVRDFEAVKTASETGSVQLVDARSRGRFEGTELEVRASLRPGHIPGGRNLPFTEVLGADKTMLPPEILKARFEAAGIDLTRPIIASCGSGVSACVLALALHEIGRADVPIYDGSWSEWGARDVPVAVGPA